MSDLTKAPVEIILDLINKDNDLNLTAQQVELVDPTPLEDDPDGLNTSLSVVAIAGSGYKGFQIVRYNRIDISTVPTIAGWEARIQRDEGMDSIHSILSVLNLIYEINLVPEDVEDAEIPPFTGELNESIEVDVVIKPESLVFFGTLRVTLYAEEVNLADIITVTALDGLTYTPTIQPEDPETPEEP